jgi:hypothetical protein
MRQGGGSGHEVDNPELDTTFVLMEGAGIGLTLKKRPR